MNVSTVWTLERFREKLSAMRQLYENAETSDDDEDDEDGVFCDPDDAWVADSPSSSQCSHLLSPHLYVLFTVGLVGDMSYVFILLKILTVKLCV